MGLAEFPDFDAAMRLRLDAATGRLAVSQAECRDILFATMDGTLWRRLVVERGWSDERYADWLGSLWIAQLVSAADAA